MLPAGEYAWRCIEAPAAGWYGRELSGYHAPPRSLLHPCLPMNDDKIRTPCVGICSTVFGDHVCRGCKRFLHEIIDWNSYSEAQKRAVDQRLESLLSRVVEAKLQLLDEALLYRRLEALRLRVPAYRGWQSAALELLRAASRQIDDLREFGLAPMGEYRGQSPVALREDIDREFFLLSESYHARYIRLDWRAPAPE